MVWKWVFAIVGAISFVYGIYQAITRRPNKEKVNTHTQESLKKYALVEGISSMVTGAALICAGICYSNSQFTWLLIVDIVLIIGAIAAEFSLEKKILKPIEKK